MGGAVVTPARILLAAVVVGATLGALTGCTLREPCASQRDCARALTYTADRLRMCVGLDGNPVNGPGVCATPVGSYCFYAADCVDEQACAWKGWGAHTASDNVCTAVPDGGP